MTVEPIQEATESMLSDIRRLQDVGDLDGGELSKIALRLSVNKAYIGQYVAEKDFELSNLIMQKKIEWGRIFSAARISEAKTTVKDAEMIADSSVAEQTMDEIELERQVSLLKNLRRDASDVITTVQTRIGQLKAEMVEVNSISAH